MSNKKKKPCKCEEDEHYGYVTLIGPTWAAEPLTYCSEYLAGKGFYVKTFFEGKPGGGCIPTPGHPCNG